MPLPFLLPAGGVPLWPVSGLTNTLATGGIDPAAVLKSWLGSNPELTAMAPQPTVTVRGDNANPGFTPRTFYPVTDADADIPTRANLINMGAATLADGVSRDYYKAHYTLTGTDPIMVWRRRTDAQIIAPVCQSGARYQLIVDGKMLAAGVHDGITSGGNRRVVEFDIGSSTMRDITLIIATSRFAGVFLPAAAQVLPPATARPLLVADMGDSYWQSDGERFKYGLAFGIASRLGTPVVFNDAVGGTGFLQANAGVSPTTNNYLQRLGYAAPNQTTPDNLGAGLVIMGGGINDTTSLTVGQVLSTLQAAKVKHPNAVICAIGPQCPRGDYASDGGQKYVGISQKIKDALAQLSGPWIYVDPLTNTWLNSKGATGGPNDGPWITGVGRQIVFTAALAAAEAGTLTSNWNLSTGSYTLTFSDGSTRTATLTNGSAAVTWTGAVTATANASAYSGAPGNAHILITDGTHLDAPGTEFWAGKGATLIRAAAAAL